MIKKKKKKNFSLFLSFFHFITFNYRMVKDLEVEIQISEKALRKELEKVILLKKSIRQRRKNNK